MGEKNELDSIVEMLIKWVAEVKLRNSVNDTKINHTSENLVLRLLNAAYGYNLTNLNWEVTNYQDIDLGDRKRGIAFQVTAKDKLDEIKKKLKAFYAQGGQHEQFPGGLYFFFLKETPPPLTAKAKQSLKRIAPRFDPGKQMWSMKTLLTRLTELYSDVDRSPFSKVKQLIEEEFGSTNENNINRVLTELRKKISRTKHKGLFVTPIFSYSKIQPPFDRIEPQDIFDILRASNRTVVLGNIGYGKTTLCERYAAEKKTREQFWLPLLVPLRFYDAEAGVYKLICRTIERLGTRIDIDGLDYLIKEEKPVSFILDGFNEMAPADRNGFLQDIKTFSDLAPHHQIIITCQHEHYHGEFEEFPQVCLQAWTEAQVKEYLKQAVYSEEAINDFLAKSGLNNECKGLLAHPFFVEYLVKEYRERNEFPANRKMLMDCILERWLKKIGTDEKGIRLAEAVRFNLAEFAFILQKEYSMSMPLKNAERQITSFYSSAGGQDICGYSSAELWKSLLQCNFIIKNNYHISFIHEMWQDYFASLKLENLLDKGDDSFWELVTDTWWHHTFLLIFNKSPHEKIRELLKAEIEKGEYTLLGYALRRETGGNANEISRNFICSLTSSENPAVRNMAYKAMGIAADTPWCIQKLLNCIDNELRHLVINKGEAFFNKIEFTSDIPGYDAYRSLVCGTPAFPSLLPIDSLETILAIDTKARTPFARQAVTELLQGAISLIPDEELINILKKLATDKIHHVRKAATLLLQGAISLIPDEELINILEKLATDKIHHVRIAAEKVIWRFWLRSGRKSVKGSLLYPKIVSILKTENGMQSAELLKEMGELDNSEWVTEQYLSLLERVDKAVQDNDPMLGYYFVSGLTEDILYEPYRKAYESIGNKVKRQLLRLTVDHIIRNRIRLEKCRDELDSIIGDSTEIMERRLKLLDDHPELCWGEFCSVLRELGYISTDEDFSRFRELIINTPAFWDHHTFGFSNRTSIAWVAAEALVNNGYQKNLEILRELLTKGHHTTIIATLALIYGEQLGHWKTNSFDLISCRRYSKGIKARNFFLIFHQFVQMDYDGRSHKIVNSFFKKFGVEAIRLMAKETFETDMKTALEFVGRFGMFREPDDLKKLLSDASKSDYHEKIKRLLRTPDKNISVTFFP